MKATMALTRILLGSVLGLAACSSSSSNTPSGAGFPGSEVSCKTGGSSSNQKLTASCKDCVLSKCAAETSAVLGNDPSKFGGACGELSTCTCNCENGDAACLGACFPKITPDCSTASKNFDTCGKTKCSAECNTDAGSSADAG